MANGTVKIKDKFFEWSSITDSPVSYGMSRNEYEKFIRENYGFAGRENLNEMLDRVEATGVSYRDISLEGLLSVNRAGHNETNLSADEIYEMYAKENIL